MTPAIAVGLLKGNITGAGWSDSLDAQGYALTGPLLSPEDCTTLIAAYDGDGFRSSVVMARHGFGRGEYRYFAYPLPDMVQRMRETLYPPLADIARLWARRLGAEADYPPTHKDYRARCHEAGQTRPTPLLLRYGPGDFNCLHQDLYGALVFPLQVAILLSRPGDDFTGGEFVLTEQVPRRQSRAEVVPLTQGCGVVFPVHHRAAAGSRGFYQAVMRHGVSRLHTGSRHVLGIIFHDAH